MWTVQEAKAKLSEVLKRAKAGELQVQWLVDNAARGFELEMPTRSDDRPDPFAWIHEVDTDASSRSANGREAEAKKRRM
jgi:hypothetical protein